MLILRSVVFYATLVLLTLLLAPIHLSIALLTLGKVQFYMPLLYIKIIFLVLKIVGGVSYKVTGLENIPQQQNYIALINHQTGWEVLFFYMLLRPLAPIIKKSLLYIPLFGWSLALLKPIALDRGKTSKALKLMLDKSKKRLDAGFNIMIYPEGTRSTPPKIGKFKKGGSLVAATTAYPILPIAHNAGYFITKHFMIKQTGVIFVTIGAIINSNNQKANDLYITSTEWITRSTKDLQL